MHTNSETETEQLGEILGRNLKGGEVIELLSDLGGGKTAFTRGLVRGAGSTDHVASPTFTISKLYKAPGFAIHHFDFYRLGEAGLMEHELKDLIGDPKTVIVIEWGQAVRHVLPDERLRIEIIQTDTDSRDISINYSPVLGYILNTMDPTR